MSAVDESARRVSSRPKRQRSYDDDDEHAPPPPASKPAAAALVTAAVTRPRPALPLTSRTPAPPPWSNGSSVRSSRSPSPSPGFAFDFGGGIAPQRSAAEDAASLEAALGRVPTVGEKATLRKQRNKESAALSRQRSRTYIKALEDEINRLQARVHDLEGGGSALHPRGGAPHTHPPVPVLLPRVLSDGPGSAASSSAPLARTSSAAWDGGGAHGAGLHTGPTKRSLLPKLNRSESYAVAVAPILTTPYVTGLSRARSFEPAGASLAGGRAESAQGEGMALPPSLAALAPPGRGTVSKKASRNGSFSPAGQTPVLEGRVGAASQHEAGSYDRGAYDRAIAYVVDAAPHLEEGPVHHYGVPQQQLSGHRGGGARSGRSRTATMSEAPMSTGGGGRHGSEDKRGTGRSDGWGPPGERGWEAGASHPLVSTHPLASPARSTASNGERERDAAALLLAGFDGR